VLDILSDADLLECRAVDIPMETNVKCYQIRERTCIILVDIEDWLLES